MLLQLLLSQTVLLPEEIPGRLKPERQDRLHEEVCLQVMATHQQQVLTLGNRPSAADKERQGSRIRDQRTAIH